MQLNVVIATHKRRALLERTLQSLVAAARPPELERIIVVENGSDDGARALCDRYQRNLALDYRHRAEPGKSRGLQFVIEELERGLVVFLDDDVRVSPSLLEIYAIAAAGAQCQTRVGARSTRRRGPVRFERHAPRQLQLAVTAALDEPHARAPQGSGQSPSRMYDGLIPAGRRSASRENLPPDGRQRRSCMLPKHVFPLLLVLIVGLAACSKIEQYEAHEGSIRGAAAPFTDAIPKAYGRFVGVSHGDDQGWNALWFEKPDGTITVVGVNWVQRKMLTEVAVVERR